VQQKDQENSLNAEQQQQAEKIDQQIQDFEQQLKSKSNADLKQIANQLDTVEREMLLEKIDQQLQTIKETLVKPGDMAASTAAAGAGAAAAVAIQSTPTDTTTTS
jgi:hypothetical protein